MSMVKSTYTIPLLIGYSKSRKLTQVISWFINILLKYYECKTNTIVIFQCYFYYYFSQEPDFVKNTCLSSDPFNVDKKGIPRKNNTYKHFTFPQITILPKPKTHWSRQKDGGQIQTKTIMWNIFSWVLI